MSKKTKQDSETYSALLEKVETIVEDIGDPELPLDDLVAKVEQGYEMITKMRVRLDETKTRIEELRSSFDQ